MRRLLLLACCSSLACTRENPAFDDVQASGESETRASSNTSEDASESEAEAEAETEAESSEGPDDLPDEPPCAFQPTAGLAIRFSDTSHFGGVCPNGVNIWATISSADGGEATFTVCTEGCTTCGDDAHELSAFPMLVTDYLPQEPSKCVIVQTSSPFGEDTSSCIFGALSVHDPLTGTPYVIATTHSSAPTPYGIEVLGDSIPAPEKAGNCNCEDVGQGNDCCYQAEGPPEFWYFPYEGAQLYPGDFAPMSLANQPSVQHYFKVYQAENLRSCASQELQVSWAVVIDPESS
jgi:hypothetical protein